MVKTSGKLYALIWKKVCANEMERTYMYTCTVRLEKLFPFCYRCTFLKRCDRLRSVLFYYRSPFRVITVLRFVSFAACV